MSTISTPASGTRYSALFVDLENIYYYLKNNGVPNPEQVTETLIRETRHWLYREWQEPCIIQTFVLIAGDRDYIPLVQHLQRQARQVLIVSFRGNLSGDLLHIVGESNFVDAERLVGNSVARILQVRAQVRSNLKSAPLVGSVFNPPLPVEDADTRRCLTILVNAFGSYHAVWPTPFLRRLNEDFPLLANYERQALISNLVSLGAIRVEKREGNPYPYSVAMINNIINNWNHLDVRALNQAKLPISERSLEHAEV
ncbi:MAG: hypothetical protein C4337_06580 [Armatimonadota bacterium]